MTDYVWPADIVPSSSEWRLVANTAAFVSPLSGSTRTLARSGDRWACSLQFNALTEAKRARLQAFLARLRGQANRVWLWDHAYRKRGSFPATELLPDPLNASAASWTMNYGTAEVSDGLVRVTAGSHTATQYPSASQAVVTVSGGAYVARVGVEYSSAPSITNGLSISAGTVGASSLTTTNGMKTASVTSDGATGSFAVIWDDDVTSGNYFDASFVSYSRCALIAGASQTGSVLNTDTVPTATDLLLPGDMVQIGDYLYMVTMRFGSAPAVLHITPPLRTSPADNTPIIIHRPMAKMMLADQTVGWSNAAGGRVGSVSNITLQFVEDLA